MGANPLFQHIHIPGEPKLGCGGHGHVTGILTLFSGGAVGVDLLCAVFDTVFTKVKYRLQHRIVTFQPAKAVIKPGMAHQRRHIGDGHLRTGGDQRQIPEGLIIVLLHSGLAAFQRPVFFIPAVAPHLIANPLRCVLQLLTAEDADPVAIPAPGGKLQCGGDLLSEIVEDAPVGQQLMIHRLSFGALDGLRRCGGKGDVRVFPQGNGRKTIRRNTAVDILGKLGVIAYFVTRLILPEGGIRPASVGNHHPLTVRRDQIGNEPHSQVTADPDPIHKPLIVHMGRQGVAAGAQQRCHIEFVILIVLKVIRGRSLSHRLAV